MNFSTRADSAVITGPMPSPPQTPIVSLSKNLTKGEEYALNYDYSDRQTAMILAGGLLNYTKNLSKQEK